MTKRIILIAISLAVLLGSIAFAGSDHEKKTRDVSAPGFVVSGSTVTCTARVKYFGQSINARLELYQGSTLVAWWTKTGTSSVSFSEPAPFVSGLTYTLTISGTVNGTPFTPQSTTQTLW